MFLKFQLNKNGSIKPKFKDGLYFLKKYLGLQITKEADHYSRNLLDRYIISTYENLTYTPLTRLSVIMFFLIRLLCSFKLYYTSFPQGVLLILNTKFLALNGTC